MYQAGWAIRCLIWRFHTLCWRCYGPGCHQVLKRLYMLELLLLQSSYRQPVDPQV